MVNGWKLLFKEELQIDALDAERTLLWFKKVIRNPLTTTA
jgi:hypothetical protein